MKKFKEFYKEAIDNLSAQDRAGYEHDMKPLVKNPWPTQMQDMEGYVDKEGRVRRPDYLIASNGNLEKYVLIKLPNGKYSVKYYKSQGSPWQTYTLTGEQGSDYDNVIHSFSNVKPMSQKEFEEWATIEMM